MMPLLRLALGSLLSVVLVLAAAAAAFVSGIDADGEFLRDRLQGILTAAFGVPTRIEGPMRLRTGRVATVAADALLLSDPAGGPGAVLARGLRPGVRIDLGALLLRRAVVIEEVTGERLELALRRPATGQTNWTPLFRRPPGEPSTYSFAGIARLHIVRVEGTYQREGDAPRPFAIDTLAAALAGATAASATGTLQLDGHEVAFDLRSASFDALRSERGPIPVQGSLQWRGLRTSLDGQLARDRERLDVSLHSKADNALPLLDLLGLPTREPGSVDLVARVSASASEAQITGLALQLGRTALSGSGRVGWSGTRSQVALDLKAELVDLTPFVAAASMRQAASLPKSLVEALDALARGAESEVKVSIDAIDGLPIEMRSLRADVHGGDRLLRIRADAELAGTAVTGRIDYDAQQSQRRLEFGIDSRAAATAALPAGLKPSAWSGRAASLSGRLQGEGSDSDALIASLRGSLDARRVQWSLPRAGAAPVTGRFDVLRLAIEGNGTASVEALGNIGGAGCSFKATSRHAAGSLAGESSPVTITARCPGERIDANGRATLVPGRVSANLAFEASADRRGAAAQLIGIPELPRPIRAGGNLSVDERQARARFTSLRLGRSDGRSGEITIARTAGALPKLRLAMRRLDLNELGVIDPGGRDVPAHPLDRVVLPSDLRPPDLDFAVEADRVDVGELRLRQVEIAGVMQRGRMPPARFRAGWKRLSTTGHVGLDLTAASPQIELKATAENADLADLFTELGWQDLRLTAAKVSLDGQARGKTLGDLLASARLNADFEQARIELRRPQHPDAAARGMLSGSITASEGQPARLMVRGAINDLPAEAEIGLDGIDAWRDPQRAVAVTLQSTLGDLRLDADGRVWRDGTGGGRLRASGSRLDRIGAILDVALPEVAYAAGASVSLTATTVGISDLAVEFGRSSLQGELKVGRPGAGRARHLARLRAPALYIEDLGSESWMQRPADDGASHRVRWLEDIAPAIDDGLARLRLADLDATIDIDNLHVGGERVASGRIRATADNGRLFVQLQDVLAQSAQIDADLEVDAAAAPPRYRARADLRNLEYGSLLRALDDSSSAEGRLDFITMLAATGAANEIVPRLEGTIDLAMYPRGLESRALGLWGTNFVPSLLRQLDPNDRAAVECGVAGFDLADGIATSTGFFVDTTRMRIFGDLEANLVTRALSGRINARSNEPHLFTFAPTLLVSGTVEQPTFSSAPENVLLVPLRFAAPLARFTRDWLTRGGRSTESRQGCEEAFDQVRQAHQKATAFR